MAIPSPMHAESLLTTSLSVQAENWYYPVLPGDDEWAQLTIKEKYAICNMPTELLKVCSTDHLADLLLDYPFILEFWAYDDTEAGLAHLDRKSNIYHEFFTRPGAIDTLIGKFEDNVVDYELMNEDQKEHKQALIVKSGWSRDIFAQVYLGANYCNLTSVQISRIEDAMNIKVNAEKMANECSPFSALYYSEVNSCINEPYLNDDSACLYQDKDSTAYTERSYAWTFQREDNIYDDYIPPEDYGPEGPAYTPAHNIKIYDGTLSNSTYSINVNAREYERDYVNSYLQLLTEYYNNTHTGVDGGLSYLSNASIKYNCHYYAWVGLEHGFYEIPSPASILNSSSGYVSYVGTNCSAVSGNRIFMNAAYLEDTHSVIVVSGGSTPSTIYTRAKMGKYGVYMGSLEYMFEVYDDTYSYSVYR